jgi:serine/threonine protein kinase
MAGIDQEVVHVVCEPHEVINNCEKLVICLNDNCEKKCFLGEGAFGKVYRGKYTSGNSDQKDIEEIEVAVKKIENKYEDNLELKNEIKLLGKLQHHNIVRYYTGHNDANFWY